MRDIATVLRRPSGGTVQFQTPPLVSIPWCLGSNAQRNVACGTLCFVCGLGTFCTQNIVKTVMAAHGCFSPAI